MKSRADALYFYFTIYPGRNIYFATVLSLSTNLWNHYYRAKWPPILFIEFISLHFVYVTITHKIPRSLNLEVRTPFQREASEFSRWNLLNQLWRGAHLHYQNSWFSRCRWWYFRLYTELTASKGKGVAWIGNAISRDSTHLGSGLLCGGCSYL